MHLRTYDKDVTYTFKVRTYILSLLTAPLVVLVMHIDVIKMHKQIKIILDIFTKKPTVLRCI